MSIWCDRAVTGGLFFLILFTPFAFGAVHPWAYSIMQAVLFLLIVVWAVKLYWLPPAPIGNAGGAVKLNRLSLCVLPLALFVGVALFQLVPLPPSLLRILSPQTYQLYSQTLPGWPERPPHADLVREASPAGRSAPNRQAVLLPTVEEVRQGAEVPLLADSRSSADAARAGARQSIVETWRTLSIAPSLSRTDLLKIISYAALLFLVALYPFGQEGRSRIAGQRLELTEPRFVEQRFFRSVVAVIGAAGLLVAVVAFVQRFSWNGRILWFFVPFDWGESLPGPNPRSSGPFVNPDHFANYLALIFPIALSCAVFRASITGRRLADSFSLFSGFSTVVIFTGILLSLSRGGWASALLGLFILFWVCHRRNESPRPLATHRGLSVARISLAVFAVLLIVGLIVVGPQGREQIDGRIEETVSQDAGIGERAGLWSGTLAMVRDFPLLGVGLGAWPELFPRYRRAPWTISFYREAHNDYMELLAETGMIGFGLFAWFFYGVGRLLLQGLGRMDPKNLPLMAAVMAALGAMALHELVDFNLQIPANAFLFTLLLGLGLRLAKASQTETSVSADLAHGILYRAGRALPVAASIAALVLTVAALRQEQVPYPYNFKNPASVAEASHLVMGYPANPAAHLALLRLVHGAVSPATELSLVKTALDLEPINPYLRDLHAAALFRAGKTQDGLKEIAQSVEDSPSLSTHFYLTAKLLPWLTAAEKNAVEEGFNRAFQKFHAGAGYWLGEFYGRFARYAAQAELYGKEALAVRDVERKVEFLLLSGAAYVRANDDVTAEKQFRAAIAAAPREGRGYQQLVELVYGPRKDIGSARLTVEEGIKNGAPAFFLFLSLAEAAQQAGQPEERKAALLSAKKHMADAADGERDPFTLYLLLADGASKAQDREEEKGALTEALRFKPRSSNAVYRLANLYMQERNFDRAVFYFSNLTHINPKSPDPYYQLALAEEARYGFAAAAKAYAQARDLAPDHAGIQKSYEAFKIKVAQNQKAGDERALP